MTATDQAAISMKLTEQARTKLWKTHRATQAKRPPLRHQPRRNAGVYDGDRIPRLPGQQHHNREGAVHCSRLEPVQLQRAVDHAKPRYRALS